MEYYKNDPNSGHIFFLVCRNLLVCERGSQTMMKYF